MFRSCRRRTKARICSTSPSTGGQLLGRDPYLLLLLIKIVIDQLTYLCCQAGEAFCIDVWRRKAKLERNPAPQSPPLFSKWGGNDEPKSTALLALPFAVDKTAQLAPSLPSALLSLSRKPNPMQMKRVNRMNN